MIQTSDLRFTIYRGGRFSEALVLEQGATPSPVDLTGRGPFICQVRTAPGADLLLEIPVEETDLSSGRITLVAEKEATAEVPATALRALFDVIDAEGTPWVSGVVIFTDTNSELA